ncbi:MAG: YifB family Mg chelatase-like AAA ATPase [Lachnospiraceae bacterium]|nr:YifB family Mg chelatase-like AAA ATPase [Lachnospiraceae bacterium]
MFSKVKSAAIYGIESRIISVEADVSDGLPQFSMVGYLTAEVREAQDRVRTALKNSGYRLLPKKITVNLSPADIRKSGSGFDLPIAVAVMAAYGYIPGDLLEGVFLAGELSLDGSVHGIRGILGMMMEARLAGCRLCIIPEENIQEGAVIQGLAVCGAAHLKEVIMHFTSPQKLIPVSINIEEKFSEPPAWRPLDFADIKGQHLAKRAAEIAAAGRHNLLLSGPPGSGKTMIASRISGILPPMEFEEALEVSKIHSISGELPKTGILVERPFRMPHHTVSAVALAGGGKIPRPGEISLAHRGVLYLDELPEFQKETLEVLRQPLEEGEVRISRNTGQFIFPADFMLVASRNPCKCGYYPDRTRCRCSESEVRWYLHRISRPLLDRIDLHVEVMQMQYEDLTGAAPEETTAQIRQRVLRAQRFQTERYEGSPFRFNSELTASVLEKYCVMEPEAKEQLRYIYEQKNLTARSYHKMIKVARTIADLDECETIEMRHLGEAVFYRPAEGLQ